MSDAAKDTMTITIIEPMLIDGTHRDAGEVVEVANNVGRLLTGNGRAVAGEVAKPAAIDGEPAKRNTAKGLTTGDAGAIVKR